MISTELTRAREYEERAGRLVPDEARPVFHFSPRTGWLNDPNGFSYFNGQYHLFYQYHPYNSFWGPMHWGHAVSTDLIRWSYLPAALAPDGRYDRAGCFSGSAATLPDGRHLLMYTGCEDDGADPRGRWRQTQNLAISSGTEYVKFEGNPVITEDDLPPDGDVYEFRDPYIWKTGDGSYRALAANARKESNGATRLILFRSDDGFSWRLDKVLFEDYGRIGIMWECPNFFPLGGKHILIASPMDMEAEEADGSVRFPRGNNVCYIPGSYDETEEVFLPDQNGEGKEPAYYPVDMGLDFYAPQIMKAPDGRTILIGWMQDPKTAMLHDDSFCIFGQMTVPRELSLENDRLFQRPAKELEAFRCDRVAYSGVHPDENGIRLEGISGRSVDMEISLKAEAGSETGIRFAQNDRFYTELRYRPDQSVVTIDRSHSGFDNSSITGQRSVKVSDSNGCLRLRILIDKWSAEIFAGDGAQVLSTTFYTDPSAQDISFRAAGKAVMDVTKYRIDPKQEL